MRHLTSMPDSGSAERFSSYLTSMGIGNTAEEGSNGWAIWIGNDDDMERAAVELGRFQANPDDSRYATVAKIAKAQLAEAEQKQKRLRKNFVDVRTSWAKQSWAMPVLTIALIGMCLIVAGVTLAGRNPGRVYAFLTFANPAQRYGSVEGLISQLKTGQLWRLITPIFYHYDPLHLIFNLFWLRDLGAAIERRKGPVWLGAIVLVSAVASDVAQYFAAGSGFGGMSGVVYALFGYIWMKGKFEPQDGLGVSQQTIVLMLVWLVVCYFGWVGSIANTAHVVGLVIGMAMGGLPGFLARMRRRMRSIT